MGMYRNRMPDREVSAEMTKADYWEVQADMWHQNYKEAADEIERLRLLVHYAFCEGQITPFLLEDWINSRSYATLMDGE